MTFPGNENSLKLCLYFKSYHFLAEKKINLELNEINSPKCANGVEHNVQVCAHSILTSVSYFGDTLGNGCSSLLNVTVDFVLSLEQF